MGWASRNDLERWFEVPTMDQDDRSHAIRIRYMAKAFAATILEDTPGSADQSAALRHVREAMWSALAAIECRRRTEPPPSPNAYLAPSVPTPRGDSTA